MLLCYHFNYIYIGMKTVNQRCRFVTSNYRNMVLAAVDFRNRFAERPYLCEELMEPDQVVVLLFLQLDFNCTIH